MILFLRPLLKQNIREGHHESFVYGVLSLSPTTYHTVLRDVIDPVDYCIHDSMKAMLKDKVLKLHKTDKKTVVVESEDQLQAYERMIDAIKKY
jgi:hypothetical protein